MKRQLTLLILNCLLLSSPPCLGQTRTKELEDLRSEHEKQVSPDTPEKFLLHLKDDKILERINYGYSGLRAKVGGLVSGGFTLGPECFREDLANGSAVLRTSA
jgi:hypothetical protein